MYISIGELRSEILLILQIYGTVSYIQVSEKKLIFTNERYATYERQDAAH